MDGMITNGTVLTLGGVYLLSQTAYVLVGIWARFRRSPPIDQTLQNYVRRDEFDKLRDELRRTDAKVRAHYMGAEADAAFRAHHHLD